MKASGVVVANVLRQRAVQRGLGRKRDAARQLRLERVKEGFGAGVVAGAADARTLFEPMPRDERTEGDAHVLRPAIAVKDQAARRATALERPREHQARFPRRSAATEGPREHAARVMIQYDREIAPAVDEAEICDVAEPDLVASRDVCRPYAIRMLREARANAGLRAIAAHRLRAESGAAHEPSHAVSTHRPAGANQLPIDPRTAIALLVLREASNDLGGQRPVLKRVCTRFASAPRVEPRARDVIPAAERSDLEAFVLGNEMVDEREDFACCGLQNRMAFFKRSCSSFSSAYRRSSRWNCAISRAGPAGGAFGGRPRKRPSFASLRHFESMKG